MLVVRELFACGGAVVAAFLTALEHVRCQWTLPRTQGRACLAAFGTVGAELSGLFVFLLPAPDQSETMLEAAVALELAIGAYFRALH